MGQTDRLYQIKRLLDGGRCVTRDKLLRTLEVSPATLKRDIAKLRDQLNWPIKWDKDRQGWQLDKTVSSGGDELPGLWLTPDEAHALLTMQHVIAQLDMGGLLAKQLQPIARRLDRLAKHGNPNSIDVGRYLRVAQVATRRIALPCFQVLGHAVLRRHRVFIEHYARERNELRKRTVSPQRLIHYRGNWYLDAWCHTKEALRSFAVDAIQSAQPLNEIALDMTDSELDASLGAGYGIFAGAEVTWATLRFGPARSRWVAHETWHPDQQGSFDNLQRWVLRLPYSDDRELLMDIMRHVPDVEVLEPAALAAGLREKLLMGIHTVSPGSRGEPGD
jgi:predicted DNA-binding transcriptional regulator YafY